MYTITVKDSDKQIFKVHGKDLSKLTNQLIGFITGKYQFKRA